MSSTRSPHPGITLTVPPQPTITSCGPTCLHAVYHFHGLTIPIHQLIRDIPDVQSGGTLAVLMGIDALKRGFAAELYTCNLRIFDPTWFQPGSPPLEQHLKGQLKYHRSARRTGAIRAYLDFAQRGGRIFYEDLSRTLLRSILRRQLPVLTGLSATALYREAREIPETNQADPLRGEPVGHFVVLSGYDQTTRTVAVGDPLDPNPMSPDRHYDVGIDRLIHAILLGVLTYDGNLLILSRSNQNEK